ncbi:hypothetical protein JCM10213_004184 [Rhodosporidiobolus nylandii]
MSYAPRASTLPSTPGRGQGYTSTTPRSVRRVLASSTSAGGLAALNSPGRASAAPALPALQRIAFRPYPERPYAEDDELRQLLEADRDAVDEAVRLLELSLSETKKAVFEASEEIAAEKKRLEKLTRELGDAAKEMVKKVQDESREVNEAKEAEAKVLTMGRSLTVQVESLQGEVKEVLNKLEARRELKAKQRAAFAKQASRNAPELEFFEQKLGLKIRGKARDVVQFKFHNLDPSSFPRPFSFDLDASASSYTLAALSPPSFLPPSVVDPALSRLNTSRDLYAFIREMRQLFVDEVALEKRGLSEPEREAERRKVREGRERR